MRECNVNAARFYVPLLKWVLKMWLINWAAVFWPSDFSAKWPFYIFFFNNFVVFILLGSSLNSAFVFNSGMAL